MRVARFAALGCVCGAACSPTVSFVGPREGDEVFGVVLLTAESRNARSDIRFYLDEVDDAHLIGVAAGGSAEWRTTATANGAHRLLAVVDEAAATIIDVTVGNRSRAEAIPSTAVKMTTATDAHPPILNPAYSSVWENPVLVAGPIDTAGAEDSPFVSPDGTELYFFFTPDAAIPAQSQLSDRVTGIWRSAYRGGSWSEPERVWLTYFPELSLDGCGTLSGTTLWFCSARNGGFRPIDLYKAQLVGGQWTRWENAGETLNKTYEAGEMHVTAAGDEMYFHADRPGGRGDADIWVTKLVNGEWQQPTNVEAVNTWHREGWPFVSEDGTQLWFTKGLMPSGAPTVWMSKRVGGAWQAPEQMLSPLAGEPTLDRRGNLYFVHHYFDDAKNRIIEADLFLCRRK